MANPGVRNPLGKIDLGNPRMQPMIRMLQSNIERETKGWQPGPGISARRMEMTAGKASFSCWLLEPEKSQGTCLFCHGGGMIFPLQVSSLRTAGLLARATELSMVVPDYHMPPRGAFPVPVEECLAAWQRMHGTGFGMIYGESIGGAIAVSLAMQLRDGRGIWPDRLMLIEPVTDSETETYPSAALDDQAAWTMRNNRHMWDIYLPDPTARYAVPIRESAAGLPPTYLETAEMDILRDEGEAFGRKLLTAGVPVKMNRVAGAWHGFDVDPEHPACRQALEERIRFILEALNRSR